VAKEAEEHLENLLSSLTGLLVVMS
jgi:hypothetical protein